MQAIQPRVKELQAMYANDPERLQMETARLYKEANFNPLAGCLPTFATLPVFIGLYRALSNAASGGCPHRRLLLDPSPRRPRVHRRPQRRHRFRMAHRFLLGRPPSRMARHHRVSRAPRAVGGVAVREPKDHAAGHGRVHRSGSAADAGDSQVFARDDWLLLAQRPRGAHAVLVRQQHPVHRADGVPA